MVSKGGHRRAYEVKTDRTGEHMDAEQHTHEGLGYVAIIWTPGEHMRRAYAQGAESRRAYESGCGMGAAMGRDMRRAP